MIHDREVLPQRRPSTTFNFEHGKFVYTATVGYYPGWKIGEVFLSAAKTGTELDIATRDAAILLSMALQHGAPLETMRDAMTRDSDGKPEGAIGVLLDRLAPR